MVVEVLVIVDVVDAEDEVVVDAVVQAVVADVERKERRNGFPSPSSAVWSAMARFAP